MAAIDEARCSRSVCQGPWSVRFEECDPPLDHDWWVPVSAIAAALDGLPDQSGGGGLWEQTMNIRDRQVRRALLGEVPTEAKENET